jgi:hypothetical protein
MREEVMIHSLVIVKVEIPDWRHCHMLPGRHYPQRVSTAFCSSLSKSL